jgi:flavodoxin
LDFRNQLDELTTRPNPAAFAAAIHLFALQTRSSSERRHAAKLHMLRRLFAGNWNVQELSDLVQVIDLMMPTPWKWQKEASMDIYELYDANKHADKNSFAYAFWELTDKRGRMKGRAEGRVEGRAEGRVEGRTEAFCEARDSLAALVEQQLATQFGNLPASAINALGEATEEQLEQLALALLRVRTLDDALVVSGLIA